MCRRITLIILFLFFITAGTFAETFTVISNADSGPGTLREALTKAAANGSAEKDAIVFNLPNTTEAGRTINLVSQLPDISSNLVIDGTTQAGAIIGKSNAHVEIATPENYITIVIFKGQNVTNIEIYGLYLYDFSSPVISYPDLKYRAAIQITESSNITIGGANKGNLISGFAGGTLDIESTDNLKIQGNVIGLNKYNTVGNEQFRSGPGFSGFLQILKCDHITLGGDGLDEGNIIFVIVWLKFYEHTTSTVSIRSNNFLVYQDGLSTEWYMEFYNGMVSVGTIFSNSEITTDDLRNAAATVNMDMSNNVTGCQIAMFGFEFIKGTVNVTNNYFNIARDHVTDIKYTTLTPPAQSPIQIQNCAAQFNFGTNDINKKNYFNNVIDAVAASDAPNIFLRYNDFKCVQNVAYTNYKNNYTLPDVVIAKISGNGANTSVTGTATPNAAIDIYSSESCQSQCSIRSYLQTTHADNSGEWQANVSDLNGIF